MTAKSALLVITGASRGLGRSIATAFHRHYAAAAAAAAAASTADGNTRVQRIRTVLLARSMEGLQETKRLIEKQQQELNSRNTQSVVSLHSIDLSDLSNLEKNLDEILNGLTDEEEEDASNSNKFDQMILINSAGSLGKIGPCWNLRSLSEMQQVMDFNITSSLWVSIRFLRFAMQQQQTQAQTTLVNISSLTAVQAFPSMGLYSAGKAARDMFHACMSQELGGEGTGGNHHSDNNNIKILNYAPGPLETDMVEQIRSAPQLDPTLKPHYQKKLVDPDDSAQVLVSLLLPTTYDKKNQFASGSHVDYYDLI